MRIPIEDLTDEEDEEEEEDEEDEKGEKGEGGDDKGYFVMKSKAVEIAKEVKRGDGWWRFACGNV